MKPVSLPLFSLGARLKADEDDSPIRDLTPPKLSPEEAGGNDNVVSSLLTVGKTLALPSLEGKRLGHSTPLHSAYL